MGARIRLSLGHRVRTQPALPKPPSFERIEPEAMAALAEAAAALDAAGVRWWLTYGALLGAVRDGRLIAWDDDLDFAIAPRPGRTTVGQGQRRAVLRELRARGFRRLVRTLVDGEPTVEKLARGRISIDLYLLRDGGAAWEDRYRFDDRSICISSHPKMAVTRRQLGGIDIAAPSDAENYVKHLYGPSWRQPVADWDYRWSPPNVTIELDWWSGILLLAQPVAAALERATGWARRLRKAIIRRLRRRRA